LPRKDLKVEDWLSRDWKEHHLPLSRHTHRSIAHMDAHAYGSNSTWQSSPSFHVPEGFESSLCELSSCRNLLVYLTLF
jgi:hypothetical protein